MSELQSFQYTAGDTLPEITAVLCDADLTGYTITLHVERIDGSVIIRNAIFVDATQGHFMFDWTPTDLIAGPCQLAEIQFIDPGGDVVTSPKFALDVVEEIA